MTANAALATVDAALSLVSIVCLVLGRRAIRARPRQPHHVWLHRQLMIAAFSASAAFLILFVVRFAHAGFGRFHHGGVAKVVYQIIFFAHEPVAVINVPLAIAALGLGLVRSDEAHREVAPFAYWIWLWVAASGVAIWFALYVL